MAKGNLFLGNGRGSVGDITLSVLNGKQLSRRRARVVANPQSASQQLQRMIMSTVTGNAARLRSLISHSFQGVRAGAESYNYFNRVNLKLLRSQAISGQIQGFRIKGAETFVPCEGMILGKGILNTPTLSVESDHLNLPGVYQPSTFSSEADYLNAIATSFNAQPGDEIAVLFVRQTAEIAASYDGFYQFKCVMAVRRLVFLPWDNAFVGQSLVTTDRKINSALLDYSIGGDNKPRTIIENLQAFIQSAGQLQLSIGSATGYVAGAIFLSRPDSQGGWYNSNTTLVVGSDVYYKQDEVTAADIQGSYGPAAAQEPVSDYYLEQSVSESEITANQKVVAAAGNLEVADQDWEGIIDSDAMSEGELEINRSESDNSGVMFIALNFLPQSVNISGSWDSTSADRIITADIPAGSSIYKVVVNDGENTDVDFNITFRTSTAAVVLPVHLGRF